MRFILNTIYSLFGIHNGGGPLDGKQKRHLLLCLLYIIVVVGGIAYLIHWELDQRRIKNDAAKYASMYDRSSPIPTDFWGYNTPKPTDTPEPTAEPTAEPTEVPTAEPTAVPTEVPTAEPTAVPTEAPTQAPTVQPTAVPTEAPTAAPTDAPTAAPTAEPTQDPTAEPTPTPEPLATPDENTVVVTLPPVPPMQESFRALLQYNEDTIGYLTVGELVSLPVVQRENDNDFYLKHNFSGQEAEEGALFLDGTNRLGMSDMNLIVYGHNMRNDTMFGRLDDYRSLSYLKEHGVITFDTVYRNGTYVPFAVFVISADENSSAYYDIRRFSFTEESYAQFVSEMKSRSELNIPVDVEYGDEMLLLVTCNYTRNDGRFVLALRRLRDGEAEADIPAMLAGTTRN